MAKSSAAPWRTQGRVPVTNTRVLLVIVYIHLLNLISFDFRACEMQFKVCNKGRNILVMCFINVHQCHVMQSVSLMFRHLWLTTSCSCLLEAEGCRGAVQRTALCHLRRAVPRLFPAQMEVNASLSPSWQDEIGRK